MRNGNLANRSNRMSPPVRAAIIALAACAVFFASCDIDGSTRMPTFTVAFSANGGEGAIPAQTVNVGSAVTFPGGGVLSKTGFTFTGWNTAADGSGAGFDAGDTFTPTADMTVHAVWLAVFTVTFDANNGMGTAPAPQQVNAGDGITLPGGGALSKIGFAFAGWNINAGGTGDNFGAGDAFAPTESVTLYANWNPGGTFLVNFNANGGTGTLPPPQRVTVGAGVTIPGGGGLSKTGYTFGGWNTRPDRTGDNLNEGAAFTPTANITLYANWNAVGMITVSFSANSGTGALPATQTISVGTGIPVPGGGTLSRGDFVFAGWNTAGDGGGTNLNPGDTFMPTGNVTLHARWTATVTLDINGGTGTLPGPQTVNAGSGITLPDGAGLSRQGFAFGGWSVRPDGAGDTFSAGATYTPTGDITLYARWLAAFTITFDINQGGGTVPSPQTVNEGSPIVLPGGAGLSRQGFAFGGWNTRPDGQGANFGGGSLFPPTGNVTLYARWLVVFTVTFNANGGTGTLPPQTVNEGAGFTFPGGDGLVRNGFVFGGWNTMPDGSGGNFNAGTVHAVSGNLNLYARWLATWTAAPNSAVDTTVINIVFVEPITGLTASNIIVTDGTGAVMAGALTGEGRDWFLAVTVTSLGTGNVSVSINRPGIDGAARTVNVSRPPVSWTATAHGTPHTGAIDFVFDGSVTGLDVNDITIVDGTGAATAGALTGSGASRRLAVTVARAGTIEVSIDRPGIQSRTETLDVSAITWTATANNAENTTAIDFVFSAAVTGLTVGHITVEEGTVAVTTGALTGGGTAWSLAVGVENRGNVSVSIAMAGVETGPRVVTVYVREPFRMISAGGWHTVAIRDGELWAWGHGGDGRLGVGDTATRDIPVRIGTATDWVHVSAGAWHTVGIRANGSLWAWGSATDGRTGLGLMSGITATPIQVGTATDWVYVSAGNAHTVGIREDASGNRTLWAWGNNGSGRLGIGGTTSQNLPQRVGAAVDWVSVSAGEAHTMAIRDGELWAWGNNGNWQLGDGTATNRNVPTRIGTATNWVTVSAGSSHTVATRRDGSLWAWGNNGSGRLGDGTTTSRASPTRIGADNDWASATAGDTHTLAIRTTGTLWAWGSNTNGRLGDGTTTARNIPVLIQLGTTWASVSAGTNHSTAVRKDGTFRVWGRNQYGQLAEDRETTTQRTSPTLVTIP